jgi:IS1 family transposase
MPLPPCWSSTSSGHWCSKKPPTPRCGWRCAARRVTWSLLRLEIGAGKTCQRLWEAIPEQYRQGHCFTDFWGAYAAVMPETQHSAVGKETGETAHGERWKNTLRQRLARVVRRTVSFSKSVVVLHPRGCSLFSIATIESGPSCLSEPLPCFARVSRSPSHRSSAVDRVAILLFQQYQALAIWF